MQSSRREFLKATGAATLLSGVPAGWAGGVYQWETIEDARAFYGGPWLDGIVERYGMKPQVEFYEVFALTDNARGTVECFKEPVAS